MRTRKGIKYKTRNKRGKGNTRKGNTRKGKHNGRHRRKRTFKIRGGGWFSWSQKVKEEPGALDILSKGAGNSAKTLARTTSKAMNLVTETAERSVELAGASVNLGLNITHGTVDTTNLAFLTVNTMLQRCLNFVKKRFDESYTQISQCEDRNYKTPGECVQLCITPIMTNFKAAFTLRRKEEYANLYDSINKTRALIDKSIDYFCKRGFIFGRICKDEFKTQKTESNSLYSQLMKKIQDTRKNEDAYVNTTFDLFKAKGDCASVIPLCVVYIETLCIPCQKLEGINDSMKKQEELLLLWNKKIEDAKQRAELESFLKTIDKQLTKFEKEKQIREKKASQKKRQAAKIEKVVSLLKKLLRLKCMKGRFFLLMIMIIL